MVDVAHLYITDFGNVWLPYDFPNGALRKNGQPDRRRKVAPAVAKYFEDLNEAARQEYVAGNWPGNMKLISWKEWLAKS